MGIWNGDCRCWIDTKKVENQFRTAFSDSIKKGTTLVMTHDFLFFKDFFLREMRGIFYFGKKDDFKEAICSDGFSIEGSGFGYTFSPKIESIHPKHQEYLARNRCTKFNKIIGPQIITFPGCICQYCANNCSKGSDLNIEWSIDAKCRCKCKA